MTRSNAGSISADIVIVGAGMAGLELARSLETSGASVVVLEAGPDDGSLHNNAALDRGGAVRRWLRPDSDPYFWQPWTSLTPPHFTGASGIRRRVGGRGLYWYGVSLPIESWALDTWPTSVADDLRGRQHERGLLASTTDALSEWSGQDLADTTVRASLAGLDLRGLPRAARRTASAGWEAYSPTLGASSPVRLLPHHRVLALEPGSDAPRARVQTAAGDQTIVHGAVLVLAAGAVLNAALLSTLELAPGQQQLRRGITDHITQGVFVRFDGDGARRLRDALPQGGYVGDLPALRSKFFVDVSHRPDGSVRIDMRCTGEQAAPGGEIGTTLTPDGQMQIVVSSGTSAADRPVLEGQRTELNRIWDDLCRTAGTATIPLRFRDFDRPGRTNEFALPEHRGSLSSAEPATWAGYLGTEDHEGTSTAIGDTLDARLAALSHPGLFVAGPSVFPRLGAANPVLTMLALSRRLAATIG